MKKGKLIVVEGCDGAGKETQVKLLIENLQKKGLKVGTLSFPRYKDTVGGKLLAYALGKDTQHLPDFAFSKLSPDVASLLYAMDRRESKEAIEKSLEENDIVILDRYYTANLLHQGAKIEDEILRGEFIKKFSHIELDLLGIPKPDLVFYLQIPFEVTLRRIHERSVAGVQIKDLAEADVEYVERSNKQGKSIADMCGWEVINGVEGETELSREKIAEIVLSKVEEKLSEVNSEKTTETKFIK
jgi:dTMP kinase